MASDRIFAKVPATTANMGPGFDSLGLALGMFNIVEVWSDDTEPHIIRGEGAGALPTGPDNLVREAMRAVAERADRPLARVGIRQSNDIPLARGLGSSSAAIIGGCIAANYFLGRPLSDDEILSVAVEIEGHPDNVAPALYGGMMVCYATEAGTG
ncbi:MAG TPA: homoserine kinase, partial [Armatimonadota bacterium]|nr:homoserine kinase [Armatimonadota bacterium]